MPGGRRTTILPPLISKVVAFPVTIKVGANFAIPFCAPPYQSLALSETEREERAFTAFCLIYLCEWRGGGGGTECKGFRPSSESDASGVVMRARDEVRFPLFSPSTFSDILLE